MACAAASNGDEVWVAQATYTPPSNAGYVITASIKLYGGFQSGDASVATRSGVFMNTILEGNNSTPLNTADDVLHVVSRKLQYPEGSAAYAVVLKV